MITQTNTRQVEPDITVMEITGRLNLGNTLISVEDAIQKPAAASVCSGWGSGL